MSTFEVDTTTQRNLSVAYNSSGLDITTIGLPTPTHIGLPRLPVTVSPFKLKNAVTGIIVGGGGGGGRGDTSTGTSGGVGGSGIVYLYL